MYIWWVGCCTIYVYYFLCDLVFCGSKLDLRMSSANEKRKFYFLQQRDDMTIMRLRQLTVVSMMTGRPSWSPGGISHVDRHRVTSLWENGVAGWVTVVTQVTSWSSRPSKTNFGHLIRISMLFSLVVDGWLFFLCIWWN